MNVTQCLQCGEYIFAGKCSHVWPGSERADLRAEVRRLTERAEKDARIVAHYHQISDEAHAYAKATGAPLGTDVFAWPRAEDERLRDALKEIAKDGCCFADPTTDEHTCARMVASTGAEHDRCYPCIASAALAGGGK